MDINDILNEVGLDINDSIDNVIPLDSFDDSK
jgi:hypothetical protein